VLWPIHALRADVLHRTGDEEAARRERATAASLVEEIAAGLGPTLRRTFITRPAVNALLGQAHTV